MDIFERAKKYFIAITAIIVVIAICWAAIEFTDTTVKYASTSPGKGTLDLAGWHPQTAWPKKIADKSQYP